MDSESLRTFLAIHRAGGFTHATRLLHLSQPAISRRIALLEHEIGAPLFERIAGGAALSQAGRALLPHAERALAALEDCATAIRELRSGTAGPLADRGGRHAREHRAHADPEALRGAAPGVELTLRTATSLEVSELVRRGEATLGLRYLRDPSPDVVCTELASEPLVVACGPRHRFAGGASRRCAAPRRSPGSRSRARANRARRPPTTCSRSSWCAASTSLRWTPVDSLTAQKRLIEAGFGIALLPESSLLEERRAGSLATIEVDDLRAENPVFSIVRRGGYLSPAARGLLTLLASETLAPPLRRRRARQRGRRKVQTD